MTSSGGGGGGTAGAAGAAGATTLVATTGATGATGAFLEDLEDIFRVYGITTFNYLRNKKRKDFRASIFGLQMGGVPIVLKRSNGVFKTCCFVHKP